MKTLQRIWKDIKRGENIDVYLTIVISFVLGILNLFGLASSTWLFSAILAVLGILAISALRTEHHFEEVVEYQARSKDIFMYDFPATLQEDISKATELLLIGVTLTRTIKTYYSEFQSKLNKGHIIKVLLIDPECQAVEMAEMRNFGRADPDRTRNDIRANIMDLCELKKNAPDRMMIRTIQNPLTHGVIAINPESSQGILYMENYPYRTLGGSKPKYVLRAGIDEWYLFFKEEAQILWNNGRDWQD
jgi:hypothetical protein